MSYIRTINTEGEKTAVGKHFLGINRTEAAAVGEFADMCNLSGGEYPFLSTEKRKISDEIYNKIFEDGSEKTLENIRAIIPVREDTPPKGFCGVAGNKFYYNGYEKPMKKPAVYDDEGNYQFGMEIASDGKIQLLWANRIIIIHGYDCEKREPYIYYYDTDDEGEEKDLVKSYEYSGNDDYSEKILKIQSDGTATVSFTYKTSFSFSGGFWEFKEGDEVFIDNVMTYVDSRWSEVGDREITSAIVTSYSESLTGTSGSTYLWDISLKLKVANQKGVCPYGSQVNEKFFHIYKKIPYMSHLAIHKGRLWGANPNGEYVYASALGEIFEFNRFEGLNDDSVFLESSSQGGYTGVISCGDALVTFKESEMEAIYGELPQEMAVGKSYPGYGCLDINSCVVIDKKLYFLGERGFYCWSGFLPEYISRVLKREYQKAYAISDGICYRVGAEWDGECENLLFDPRCGEWYKGGESMAKGYFFSHNKLYFLSDDTIFTFDNNSDGVEWFCESIKYFYEDFSLKRINEIWLKVSLEKGSELEFFTSCEGEEYEKAISFCADKKGYKTLRIPIRLKEGEFWQYKIKGKNGCTLLKIKFVYDDGGGIYSNERKEMQ